MNGIYTDLAAELRELEPDREGISESDETDGEIEIKRIGILTNEAAARIGKSTGSYVTISADSLIARPLELFDEVSSRIAKELKSMLRFNISEGTVLVVGLGNREVTPDSLGPRVADQVFVTRHVKQYMPEAFDFSAPSVCSIVPGVLGITGIETTDIVVGAVAAAHPDCVIAIDSLASRRAARISTTVQLSNAGISPGSGVGNKRADLSFSKLGVPVIAVGVPLVVHASTILRDAVGYIAEDKGMRGCEEELIRLVDDVSEKHLDNMIMTPKDIDRIVEDMSSIVAKGINIALYGSELPRIRALMA